MDYGTRDNSLVLASDSYIDTKNNNSQIGNQKVQKSVPAKFQYKL